jgi:hypothetical protein
VRASEDINNIKQGFERILKAQKIKDPFARVAPHLRTLYSINEGS